MCIYKKNHQDKHSHTQRGKITLSEIQNHSKTHTHTHIHTDIQRQKHTHKHIHTDTHTYTQTYNDKNIKYQRGEKHHEVNTF